LVVGRPDVLGSVPGCVIPAVVPVVPVVMAPVPVYPGVPVVPLYCGVPLARDGVPGSGLFASESFGLSFELQPSRPTHSVTPTLAKIDRTQPKRIPCGIEVPSPGFLFPLGIRADRQGFL
jgi:hypothetical protein